MYGDILKNKIKFVAIAAISAFFVLLMAGCSDIDNIASSEIFNKQNPSKVKSAQDVGDIDRAQTDKVSKTEEDSTTQSYGDGVQDGDRWVLK